MLKDLISNLKVTRTIKAAVGTADLTGTAVDLQEAGAALIIANVGSSGDTLSGSVKATLEVQHCDDNSTWVAAADADISTAVTGTATGTFALIDAPGEDNQVYKVAYKGTKRYIRVIYNITGTHTNGTPVAVDVVAGYNQTLPVT